MRELGPTIAALRKEKGLGQKELASLMNLSTGTISNYENGVHSPDLNTLCRLAKYFAVTTDYLLGRTEYRCPPESLEEYFTGDYTLHNVVNSILNFDSEQRSLAIMYLDFLKSTHGRQ